MSSRIGAITKAVTLLTLLCVISWRGSPFVQADSSTDQPGPQPAKAIGAESANRRTPEPPGQPKAGSTAIDFNRDIRPILSNHCFACHGPDEQQRQAQLRLDVKEGVFKKKRDGDPIVLPGNPAASRLWQRVTAEEDRRMPPPDFGKPLNPQQVDLLRRWIEEGAPWRGHWAYEPVVRPPLPSVQRASWPRNPIDFFILARLEAEGLEPSPEADRARLIRRVTLDLTGLPPTPAEVAAFEQDSAPDAYERLVDRLLASPHYGERWAVHWLDLARYADTNGYHIDNHRDMWLWRDWVIKAFNRNMPFDQFTIEQLAGDLLPNATVEQRIASGFHRNVMVNFEGGADPDEYLTKYIVDRVNTTGTVWLGSSLACAECHDHKYDPFTQREFYQLYAFFHNVPEKGLDGEKTNPKPSLKVPRPEQESRLRELATARDTVNAKLRAATEALTFPPEPVDDQNAARREFVWVDDDLPAGVKPGHAGHAWSWTGAGEPYWSGQRAAKRQAEGLSQHYFENATSPLRIGADDELFAWVYLDPDRPPRALMLQWNAGSWEHRVSWGDLAAIPWGQPGTPSRRHLGDLPPTGRWVRLSIPAREVGLAPGSLVVGMAFTQVDGVVYWDRAGIVSRWPQAEQSFTSFSRWQEWEKINRRSQMPDELRRMLAVPVDQRPAEQTHALRLWFMQRVHPETAAQLRPLTHEQDRLSQEEATIQAAIPETMVMQEMAQPRTTHILIRGNFQKKGDRVEPDVPRFLPPLPEGVRRDRLALARWLVSPQQPLTARVTVNRWWEQFFGRGLVKTTEEFGSQGDWPSHPELLDWLAAEFMQPTVTPGAHPWDIKAIHRLIVTSATYRQHSRVQPIHLQRDPDNRLLCRGPRLRLPAEFIRDQALAVAGLLDRRLGGPSIKPYQPPGLWEQVAFGGNFSAQTYEPSQGADLYRRGLYVYWKRSAPHPSLATFDAPNREICCDRRPRTNTPLQALVLLNDPIYVEAARGLAQRLLQEGGPNDTSRLRLAFLLCVARPPTPEEEKLLLSLYHRQLARFVAQPAEAERLLSVGVLPRAKDLPAAPLAAWTTVANVLLNLDEMICKP